MAELEIRHTVLDEKDAGIASGFDDRASAYKI